MGVDTAVKGRGDFAPFGLMTKPLRADRITYMHRIELSNTVACSSIVDQQANTYVFYTGGIAGVTDVSNLQSDTETLKRSANEIELDR
jgi:pseudouridine-5'-phosphate glycosidase